MVLSVTQLNKFIKGVVDSEPLLSTLFVKGEITDYHESKAGIFFSLKDENSRIDCFAFADAQFQIANGMVIVAEGYINYLEYSGRISLRVLRYKNDASEGEEYLKLRRLKERLAGLGYFDPESKRTVPSACKRIGVVTSATGAVIHDIAKVVARRDPSVDILVCDSRVQGASAPAQLAVGLAAIGDKNSVDAVILARGGGSDEDLSAFNTETVVKAIRECSSPVISAVGHNTDFTFADYAADMRAATPSEAAELLTADVTGSKLYAMSLLMRIERNCIQKLQRYRSDSMAYSYMMASSCERIMQKLMNEAEQYRVRLNSSNPVTLMEKGYTKIRSADNSVIKNAAQLNIADKIEFMLIGGSIKAEVTDKKED